MDEIVCSGEESFLFDCEYDTVHRCVPVNNVAIICHRKLCWLRGLCDLSYVQLPVSVKWTMLDVTTTAPRLCIATPVLATLDIP